VQNPNDAPIDYNGVSVKLDVLDRTFATGVSDEQGSVPRFGESVIAVPVTISVLRVVKNLIGMVDGKAVSSIQYEMSGKLNTGTFSAWRFASKGEIAMPTSTPEPAPETT
jgi:LEA14-like dessication related protein